MKIKICGLTAPQEAEWLLENQVDYAGMVLFFPKSKRNLSPAQAKEILQALGGEINKVAVVVSPTREQVRELQQLPFDYIQIHGRLEQEVIEELQIPFLRAFNGKEWSEQLPRYKDCGQCAGYLFDAQIPGSGQCFDWTQVQNISREEGKLFFLAGGLSSENVEEAIRHVHPDGVDVSSGVERVDGKGKDPDKIRAFVQRVRQSI